MQGYIARQNDTYDISRYPSAVKHDSNINAATWFTEFYQSNLYHLFSKSWFSCSTLIRLLLWCTLWSKHATCANYSGKKLSIFDSCEESYVANDRNCCFNITQIFLTAKRDCVYRKFNPTMSDSFLNNPLYCSAALFSKERASIFQ